jgi:hypothetical protein
VKKLRGKKDKGKKKINLSITSRVHWHCTSIEVHHNNQKNILSFFLFFLIFIYWFSIELKVQYQYL